MAKSVVKRNVAANVIGGGWSVLLNLVAIPVQIRILGAESYGLIGFVTSLQGILVVFDFGIPTTVIRDVARDTSPDRAESRTLVQMSATIYWIVAGIVALAIALASGWIASHFLTVQTLTPEYVAGGIRIMALYVLLIWPLNVYVGALSGLQRLDVVNVLRLINVTASQVGGIILLLVTHDLYAFLIWLTLLAGINVVAHAWMCRRLMPGLSVLRPSFSIPTMKRVWSFSLDMNLISTLAIVFTQSDRILIGALLPLRFLGYYNVAYNVSRGIATVQSFLSSAILPALASDHSQGNDALLKLRYNKYSQVLVYLITLPSFVFMFFGRQILAVWASPATSVNAYAAMTLLTLGSLLNCVASAPYTLAIATGHSRIPLLVNLYGVIIYLVTLYYLTLRGGIEGAALAWVLLNVYYMLVLIPWIQRRALKETSFEFYARNFLPFFALCALFWVGSQLVAGQSSIAFWIVLAVVCAIYTIVGFFFLDKSIRENILAIPLSMKSTLLARFSHG